MMRRRSTARVERFNVWMTKTERRALHMLAQADGISDSDLVRLLINKEARARLTKG